MIIYWQKELNLIFSVFKFSVIYFYLLIYLLYSDSMIKDIAKYFDYWFVHERLFFRINSRFLLCNDIWDYTIIFLDKVSKIRVIVCAEVPLWRRKSAFATAWNIAVCGGGWVFQRSWAGEKGGRAGGEGEGNRKTVGGGIRARGWTLKLMIPREYPRRSTYHKSRVPRRRFFETHPEFSALFYLVHNSGVHFH